VQSTQHSSTSRQVTRRGRTLVSRTSSPASRAALSAHALLVCLARVRSHRALDEAAGLFAQAIEEAGHDQRTLAVAHEGVATCFLPHAGPPGRGLRARRPLRTLGARPWRRGSRCRGARIEAVGPKPCSGVSRSAATMVQALALDGAASEQRVLAQAALVGHSPLVLDRRARTRQRGRSRASAVAVVSSATRARHRSRMRSSDFSNASPATTRAASRAQTKGRTLARQSGQTLALAYNLIVEGIVWAERGAPDRARQAPRALRSSSRPKQRPDSSSSRRERARAR
jgi:hypothetical protein